MWLQLMPLTERAWLMMRIVPEEGVLLVEIDACEIKPLPLPHGGARTLPLLCSSLQP